MIIDAGIASSRITFFWRSSNGDMPNSSATMSSIRSRIHVSLAHGPRYGTVRPLFVATTFARKRNASKL